MKGAILLLFASWSSAAVQFGAHPVVDLLADNPGLRRAVALEFKTMPLSMQSFSALEVMDQTDAKPIAARRVALAVVAHKDEIPAGTVSELLGKEAAHAFNAFKADGPDLARIRDELDPMMPHDQDSFERMSAHLARIFDNAKVAARLLPYANPNPVDKKLN